MPGAGEQRTEAYIKYSEGAAQPATPQSAPSSSGAASSDGRQAGAVRKSRRFRRTTLITVFCLAALAGIGLSRKINIEFGVIWLAALPVILLIRSKSPLALVAIIILGLGLGLWRGNTYMKNIHEFNSLASSKVVIEARATSDAIYSKRAQIEFTANNIRLLEPYTKPIAGSFKISGFGERMIYRGDTVKVSGKFFPMRGGNQGRIAYAQLERIKQGNNPVFNMTRQFSAGMQSALPEPNASFGLGILVGQRATMPAELTAALTAVGLVHIVAVSGYNLTIIVRAISRLKLGSKYQKLLVSLTLITIFILVTGFSASIVRAAIVSVLSLWAWYYGRSINGVTLIAFTAALTGLIKPYFVWSDLGWYLSFLAFFGVLVIAPLLASRLFKHSPKVLAMILIETLCAEIMTLPLIMMSFSQLSLIGLLANLLVVPLVPVAMLFSAVAGAAGAVIPSLAGWFAWPANLLLTFILDLVRLLSGVPFASVKATISPLSMIFLYLTVFLLVVIFHRRVLKNKQIIKNWLGV